jgi:hypothetical protein
MGTIDLSKNGFSSTILFTPLDTDNHLRLVPDLERRILDIWFGSGGCARVTYDLSEVPKNGASLANRMKRRIYSHSDILVG